MACQQEVEPPHSDHPLSELVLQENRISYWAPNQVQLLKAISPCNYTTSFTIFFFFYIFNFLTLTFYFFLIFEWPTFGIDSTRAMRLIQLKKKKKKSPSNEVDWCITKKRLALRSQNIDRHPSHFSWKLCNSVIVHASSLTISIRIFW